MQTTYDGGHSIIFGDKHTWEDWGLVPASRPSVAPPTVNTNTIEIPGMNGILDLSDIPLGFPTYGSRTGSWKFYIAHDITGLTWDESYAQILAYLHGRRKTCILTDDKSYYYNGRFSVDELQSDKMASMVTIQYTLDPFKYMRWTTCEDWLWNPFDFIYGEITQSEFKNVHVNAQTVKTWSQNEIGSAPVTPTITVVSSGGSVMTLRVMNSISGTTKTVHFDDGTTTNPLVEFACPDPDNYTQITIIGNGTISFDFRPGRL